MIDVAIREMLRQVLREELPQLLAGLTAPGPAAAAPSPVLLTVQEVATRCHVRPPAVREWIRSRQLMARKAGHRHLVAAQDLERFLAAEAAGPQGAAIDGEDHVASVLNRIRRR